MRLRERQVAERAARSRKDRVRDTVKAEIAMKFEQLEVWQKACRLSEALYLECKEVKDYWFKDQLTRAGLSVPSNIAEGMERESIKE